MPVKACLLCESEVDISYKDRENRTKYYCDICGHYDISKSVERNLSSTEKERMLSRLNEIKGLEKTLKIIRKEKAELFFDSY